MVLSSGREGECGSRQICPQAPQKLLFDNFCRRGVHSVAGDSQQCGGYRYGTCRARGNIQAAKRVFQRLVDRFAVHRPGGSAGILRGDTFPRSRSFKSYALRKGKRYRDQRPAFRTHARRFLSVPLCHRRRYHYGLRLRADRIHLVLNIAPLYKQHRLGALGLPLHMSGDESDHSRLARRFKEMIEEKIKDIKVVLVDERWTTKQANRVLLQADLSRAKRKKVIDKMAATVILETYLRMRG